MVGDGAGVGFAPLKSDQGGEMVSFHLCGRVKGAQWSCAALPSPTMAPAALPVAPEPVSALLGIPGPPATLAPPWASGKAFSWQPQTKLGLSLTRPGGGLVGLNRVPRLLLLGEEVKDAPGTCWVPPVLPHTGSCCP